MPIYSVSRRRAIVLLVLSSILLITIDLSGNAVIDRARSAFARILSPFETAGRVVVTPVRNAWRGATDYDRLERENERLYDEIARQKGDQLTARAVVSEYQELLALNGLTAKYPSVTCRVVGDAPGNFRQTVEIDRGSNDGIGVGMVVVNYAGLVGKITAVYTDRSVVLLATDHEYVIEAKVSALVDLERPSSSTDTSSTGTSVTGTSVKPSLVVPRDTGAFEGRGVGRLPVMRFITDQTIDVGAVISTTGGSNSLAPPDIIIGEVINIIRRAGSAGPLLEVELAANLERLNFVQVVLYRPPSEVPSP